MKRSRIAKLKPGARVVLTELPSGFLRGLPKPDKKAISEIIGKPVQFIQYDSDGRAELEFTDRLGVIHFIYVKPSFIGPARESPPKRRRKLAKTGARRP